MSAAVKRDVGDRPKTPVHLWIVGVLALLWDAIGAFDYLATQLKLESYMSQFSQEQLDYFYAIPAWAVSGWAIAIWIGLAGTIGLLLRRRWAFVAFTISLVGLAVSSVHSLLLTNGLEIMGSGAVVMTTIIWVVAIFLVWYSRRQAIAGVLT
jgi:hypothetical protein